MGADLDSLSNELNSCKLELNELDAPFQIRRKKRRYLIAEWRLADARWRRLPRAARLPVARRRRGSRPGVDRKSVV